MPSALDQPIRSALDQKPFSYEDGMDPRVVAMMKQMGIWHPAMKLDPGTERHPNPQVQREQQAMERITNMIAHQDALNESRKSREQGAAESRQSRADTATEAERGRNERAGALRQFQTQQEQDRKTQGLVTALGQMTPGSPEHKAILNQYLKAQGIELPTAAPDAKDAALKKFAGVSPTAATSPTTPKTTAFAPTPPSTPTQPRDITAKVYGTSVATPDMKPASAIEQMYGGESSIPKNSQVGYYGDKGFLGPLYGANGQLPMPKDATGIHGTAASAQPNTFAGQEEINRKNLVGPPTPTSFSPANLAAGPTSPTIPSTPPNSTATTPTAPPDFRYGGQHGSFTSFLHNLFKVDAPTGQTPAHDPYSFYHSSLSEEDRKKEQTPTTLASVPY